MPLNIIKQTQIQNITTKLSPVQNALYSAECEKNIYIPQSIEHFFYLCTLQTIIIMLIGRKKEKERLLSSMTNDESSFIAVYGRRRVGKTYLVRETFNNKFTFYHTGIANTPMKAQLSAWRSSLREYGLSNASLPRTWLDAFDMLKDIIKNSSDRKKIVFIDEMPWMDTQRSGFVAALEHFWNGWASARKDLILIICGSATSWIINKVIKNHGGLHNRVTTKIHLQPFNLHECELYATHQKLGMNRRQIMECYMIMGGIPFYWSKLQRTCSLAQNIDNLFFNPDGELHNEFDDLYASLFKKPEPYTRVIKTLVSRRAGMTREEIIAKGRFSDNGQMTEILTNLESCGFIRRYNNYGMKNKYAIYQLIDSYTLFYYQFISNHQQDNNTFWATQTGSNQYYNWCGLSFERVCLQHLQQIKKALGISGILCNAYSWISRTKIEGLKNAQIDLIIDRSDNVIDICEIKYSINRYIMTKDESEKILNRRLRFLSDSRTSKAVHTILISANDVEPNSYSNDFQKIITADALFEE